MAPWSLGQPCFRGWTTGSCPESSGLSDSVPRLCRVVRRSPWTLAPPYRVWTGSGSSWRRRIPPEEKVGDVPACPLLCLPRIRGLMGPGDPLPWRGSAPARRLRALGGPSPGPWAGARGRASLWSHAPPGEPSHPRACLLRGRALPTPGVPTGRVWTLRLERALFSGALGLSAQGARGPGASRGVCGPIVPCVWTEPSHMPPQPPPPWEHGSHSPHLASGPAV